MSAQIRIDSRYNGPPGSANGGYVCGLMAASVDQTLSVRLYKPPPLDTNLELVLDSVSGKWHLKREEQLIAAANATRVHAHVPKPPSYVEALDASVHYTGHQQHIFPSCFVCGPQRAVNDGLRIFAGKLPGSNVVAASWLPHAGLADAATGGNGKVRPEFIWAALDCPGYFASVMPGRTALLGEFAVHIDRSVHIEEPCVIIGWQILIEGRKHKVGTALFDEEGEQCAVGVATWLEMAG